MLRTAFISLMIGLAIYGCSTEPIPQTEARGIWMSRFDYAAGKTKYESQQYIRKVFKTVRDAHFNQVYFQVRGNADAYYQSAIEPWGALLTGTPGKDPGWDPLQFALNTGHELGLEIHAWVNTFPAWRANEPNPPITKPLHPLLAHPEWVVCDSSGAPMNPSAGYISFSPGIPAVQQHISSVILDLAKRYDIDGIHFDYIRYPEWANLNGFSHDPISVERFKSPSGNPDKLNWDAWQREQINTFVQTAYDALMEVKPYLAISAAVIGSHHRGAWNGYGVVYQDARQWMANGKIDQILPMSYYTLDHPTMTFDFALDEWSQLNYMMPRIYPGLPYYKAGKTIFWPDFFREIQYVRDYGFEGMVLFSAKDIEKTIARLKSVEFKDLAAVPPLTWKHEAIPAMPKEPQIHITSADSAIFSWWPGKLKNAHTQRFYIYTAKDSISARSLIDIAPFGKWKRLLPYKSDYQYSIKAVNRSNVTSESRLFTIRP